MKKSNMISIILSGHINQDIYEYVDENLNNEPKTYIYIFIYGRIRNKINISSYKYVHQSLYNLHTHYLNIKQVSFSVPKFMNRFLI